MPSLIAMADSVATTERKDRKDGKEKPSLAFLATFAFLAVWSACRAAPPPAPPLTAQTSGTLDVAGLAAPVRVVRDRWGVPHIFADNQDDLFVAQGFVQAQDRLFQLDLWRRSVQGRLSQVLGPNFIERDAMTRRVQYRGDAGVEWASYGPDARTIAAAFVRGVNAWVARARERPPEEFVLAGWKPEFWSPEDLVNRTDAFLSSGDAIADVRRLKLSEIIAETIGRVGAAPFFAGLAADVENTGNGDVESVAPERTSARSHSRVTARAGELSFAEAHRTFTTPSPRYFVHLKAPGWNVIGATSPWLPGVAIGHNERVAWGMTPIDVDTQDIAVGEGRTGGAGARVVSDAIVVKGRRAPFVFDTEITPHGIVIAVDRERGRVFSLDWSGLQPGAAAGLGALALDRAESAAAFRLALAHWKMPARRVTFVDVAGGSGVEDAALGSGRRSGEAIDRGPDSEGTAPSFDKLRTTHVVFVHPLAIAPAARRRFNVGPLPRAGDDSAVRAVLTLRQWDQSRAIAAPGQSESPASPHFADLAALWSTGEMFSLVFTDAAVTANAEATLTLVPTTSAKR
jgi:acyl-homoserine lactone acylase PvdQ